MNPKFALRIIGICSVFAVTAFGEEARLDTGKPAPAMPVKLAAEAPDVSAGAPLTLSEAMQKVAAAAEYPAHPPTQGKGSHAADKAAAPSKFVMATPPPPPRPETKPPAPAANLVWVAGHYVPLDGQWRWVLGEWALPATPTSVWIPAAYDPKTKAWSPGYWQPDRSTPTDYGATPSGDAPAASADAPRNPNGY